MEKCHVHLPPATSQTLILSDKVLPFSYIKIKCVCTMNKRNFGEINQSAILRLIKTNKTKFWSVIGYIFVFIIKFLEFITFDIY